MSNSSSAAAGPAAGGFVPEKQLLHSPAQAEVPRGPRCRGTLLEGRTLQGMRSGFDLRWEAHMKSPPAHEGQNTRSFSRAALSVAVLCRWKETVLISPPAPSSFPGTAALTGLCTAGMC